MLKNILSLIIGFCFIVTGFSQNKQILFGFAEIPQTLLVNPGAETNYRYHIGVPTLSGLSYNIGVTGATISDLFLKDNISFNTKFNKVLDNITENDLLSFNTQIDVVNAGYRLDDKTYLTAGFYQEFDFIGYAPKDIIELLYRGNSNKLNKRFFFSQINVRGEVLGVLHAGISRKINSKLNLGGRFKIYSGSAHVSSKNNSGSFLTTKDGNNIYKHYLNNANVLINSSGFFIDDAFNIGSKDLISNSFFSKNIGVGVDVGFTYHYTPQIEFTGSILDIGFVSYSKNVKNSSLKGNYVLDGIEFLFDPNNPVDYWKQLEDDFNSKVDIKESSSSYVSWRPFKFNAAMRYSFGLPRRSKVCYDFTYKEYYTSTLGVHLYAVTRPLATQFAITSFFEHTISEQFHGKITYTIDEFSYTNVGLGLSTQIGKVNIYGMIDNIFKLADVATASSSSFQFGINLMFN